MPLDPTWANILVEDSTGDVKLMQPEPITDVPAGHTAYTPDPELSTFIGVSVDPVYDIPTNALLLDNAAVLVAAEPELLAQIASHREAKLEAGVFEHPAASGNFFGTSALDKANWLSLQMVHTASIRPITPGNPYPIRTKGQRTTVNLTNTADVNAHIGAFLVAVETERAAAQAATDAMLAAIDAADEAAALVAVATYLAT